MAKEAPKVAPETAPDVAPEATSEVSPGITVCLVREMPRKDITTEVGEIIATVTMAEGWDLNTLVSAISNDFAKEAK